MAVINFPSVKTEDEAREASKAVFEQIKEEGDKEVGVFTALADSIGEIAPTLGGYDALATLLTLDDDQFALIAPIFLDELARSCNNTQDRLLLVQALNSAGLKLEDVQEEFMGLITSIDEALANELSRAKIDFLKQVINITYNAISETIGIAKKVISVPVEYCREGAKEPQYMTDGSAGLDIYSPDDYDITPGETVVIKTGIKLAIPRGYAVLIQPRSGLSLKTSLRIPNSVGLIDSDYRDEIGVMLQNIEPKIKDLTLNDNGTVASIVYGQNFHIGKGERIAQMRLVEVPKMALFEVETVSTIGEDRGGGFGSTGAK